MCGNPNHLTVEKNGKPSTEFVFAENRLFSFEKRDVAEQITSRVENILHCTLPRDVVEVIGSPKKVDVVLTSSEELAYEASGVWHLGGDRSVHMHVIANSGDSQTTVTVARPVPRNPKARVVFQAESSSSDDIMGRSIGVWFNKEHTVGIIFNEGRFEPESSVGVKEVASGLHIIGNQADVLAAVRKTFPKISIKELLDSADYIQDTLVPKLRGILFADLLELQAQLQERDSK